jgi:hypothetical protein
MTAVNVGSAYSVFELRYSSLTQGVPIIEQQLGRLRQQTRTPISVSVDGTQASRGLQQTGRDADRALKQFQALERTFDRTRDSEIRAARAAGDHGRALQLISTALARAEQGTVRYNQLLVQQATLERQAAQAAQRASQERIAAERTRLQGQLRGGGGGGGGGGSAVGFVGGVAGAVAGATAAAAFTREQGAQALALRRTDAVTRALTGTQANYNAALELARRNQELYGGSLQENLGALGSLGILARKTGADIAALNDLSARLAIIDPTQGFEGAAVALRNAFTGDITSLAERFELPRSELRKLADQSLSTAEKLRILDQLLRDNGVTSEAAAGAIDESTKAYNNLGAALERARLGFGGGAADFFAPAARGAAVVTDAFFDGERGANAFFNVLNRLAGNNIVAGQAQQQHAAAVQGYIAPAQQAAQADAARATAIQAATEKQRTATQATLEAGQQSAASAIEQQALNIELERQKDAALAAANSLYASGAGASEAGIQALLAAGKIGVLEAAFLRLRIAQGGSGKAGGTGGPDPTQIGGGLAPLGVQGKGNAGADRQAQQAFAERQAQQARELAAAQLAYTQATESAAQRVARLRRELAQLRPQTAERINKQTELYQAEQALAAQQQKGARTSTARVRSAEQVRDATKDAADEAERLADAQERATRSALDARLAAVDDRKQRRVEARELAAAQRVLASAQTSAEQKAAARDVLERIPLEQQRRALDIASKQREGGGAPAATAAQVLAAASRPGGVGPAAVSAALTGGAAATGAAAAGDPITQIIAALSQIQFQAFIDGSPAASRVLVGLRSGLAAAQSAAPQRGV